MKKQNLRIVLLSLFLLPVLLTLAAGLCSGAPSSDDLLKRKGFVWKSSATDHFRFHFEPNTFAESRLEQLKLSQERAYARNLELLKTSTSPFQIDIFVLASRERMKQLIGSETNGIAFPLTRLVCFVFNESINASGAHELMHVMAANAWNGKPKTWLNEGLATYSDDVWYRYQLHDLNKYLLERKALIPLEKLIKNFTAYSDMVTYPQAGSFVKYLYEQYGVEKIRDLWKSGTEKDFMRALGKDLATLEKEWHARLMEADATKVKYDFSPKK